MTLGKAGKWAAASLDGSIAVGVQRTPSAPATPCGWGRGWSCGYERRARIPLCHHARPLLGDRVGFEGRAGAGRRVGPRSDMSSSTGRNRISPKAQIPKSPLPKGEGTGVYPLSPGEGTNDTSLWHEPEYHGRRWALTINLSKCIGCGACGWPARPKTTCRWSAASRCSAAAKCTGCGSTAISMASRPRPRWSFSRSPASTASWPPASKFVRSAPPYTAGGAQRHGLQPLHRHAVLRQQLPLQGAAVQLLQLSQGTERPGQRSAQDDVQSARSRPLPRRHGEVHLLRAAHPGREDRGQEPRQADHPDGRDQPPASRHVPPGPSFLAT